MGLKLKDPVKLRGFRSSDSEREAFFFGPFLSDGKLNEDWGWYRCTNNHNIEGVHVYADGGSTTDGLIGKSNSGIVMHKQPQPKKQNRKEKTICLRKHHGKSPIGISRQRCIDGYPLIRRFEGFYVWCYNDHQFDKHSLVFCRNLCGEILSSALYQEKGTAKTCENNGETPKV